MTKEILFGEEGREKLMKGVDKLANAVKSTLGAKGKNVIIGTDFGLPIITKDGVTVAKSILLPDEIENMGAALVKEVASKTAEVAGDGTTTATVLAQSIISMGIGAIDKRVNQISLKAGIDKATKAVVNHLKEISKPIEDESQLVSIASISANNDEEIGQLIAEAVSFVGVDGIVHIEESGTPWTTAEKIDGFKIQQGYIDKHFVIGSKDRVELESPVILMYDKKLSTMNELLPILNQIVSEKRSLLIISEDVEGEALKSFIVNNIKGIIKVCCIKTPGYASNKYDMMNDIAALTGGIYVSEDLGIRLEHLNLGNLGSANKVIITKDRTVIIGGSGEKDIIDARIEDIRQMIENPTDHDVKFLKHRLANLTNGIAAIKVGGVTEVEVKEKIDRIDDALNATISSMEEGYVAGGGMAYLNCMSVLQNIFVENPDEQIGVDIITVALKAPFLQIMSNGGADGESYLKTFDVSNYGYGFDVKNLETKDLLAAGIIDPTKVSRVALENAASIAGTFLTTDCIILNISED